MTNETYYVNEIKTIFFKDGASEVHGNMKYNGQVEITKTIDELKDWAVKKARVALPNNHDLVVTVFYFEDEDGLDEYNADLIAGLEGNESWGVSPSEKSWLIPAIEQLSNEGK